MSAAEVRRALFGRDYVKPTTRCDHLPEIVDQLTRTYRCHCGKLVLSEHLMVECSSANEFFSMLQHLIADTFETEGLRFCEICLETHPMDAGCPNPMKPVNEDLVLQLMEQVVAGKMTKPRAAAVCRMIPSEFDAVHAAILKKKLVPGEWPVTPQERPTPKTRTERPTAVADAPQRGFRMIDLDE